MDSKSLFTFQSSRPRLKPADLTLYGASYPACYTVHALPVKLSGGVPLSCLTDVSIYPLTSVVNPLFKKIFQPFFFKDNENARARRGSQNRRKQAKTGVLSAEKFFEKIRKSAQKRFFRRAARLFF